jgi:uncharacterized membrane protein
VFAGAYHFINPEFYSGLIPEYLPFPKFINYSSGLIEIVLGLGVALKRTQRPSAIAIIALMICFFPSHIYFIQIGSCIEGGLCVAPWISWLRLVVIHPLLIFWAWRVAHKS